LGQARDPPWSDEENGVGFCSDLVRIAEKLGIGRKED